MGFADDPDDDGTLLDGFLCVFHLEDAALWGAVVTSLVYAHFFEAWRVVLRTR
jgi:hypothetical protein